MKEFLTVTGELPASLEERLTETLGSWPVLGCGVEDVGPETILVTVYLRQGEDAALGRLAAQLEALGARQVVTASLPDADWLAEYRRAVTPRRVGRSFWVDPHPTALTPAPEGRIHLLVEPRQAFGTGSHESTALVMQLLERMNVSGRSVLDVGTGSSILALAAAALGAATVVGFDIDLEAAFVARQTVREQPARYPVALFAGPISALRPAPRFHLVLANLLPAQLEEILPEIREVLLEDGDLLVSGLLAGQRANSEAELARRGLEVVESLAMGEWVALRCRAARPTA